MHATKQRSVTGRRFSRRWSLRLRTHLAALAGAGLAAMVLPGAAHAASSSGCEGGGFTVSGAGFTVASEGDHTVSAALLGDTIQVKGKFVEFTIAPASFGIRNWLFTGAANPLDITGGRRTLVWQEKTPDHRGLILTGSVLVERGEEEIAIERSGPGLTMKIQAKDCAQGGIFQMETERGDGTRTRVTHVLAEGVFYYDNPNFRAREGDALPYKDTTVTVTPRINVGNDVSARFAGRDSPQVATRVDAPACNNQIRTRSGTFATVLHCGRISQWEVASGGRMGWVTGEDSLEVAPPSTNCVQNCQARNQVRGRAVVLGFPFPVPAASRLQPPFPPS